MCHCVDPSLLACWRCLPDLNPLKIEYCGTFSYFILKFDWGDWWNIFVVIFPFCSSVFFHKRLSITFLRLFYWSRGRIHKGWTRKSECTTITIIKLLTVSCRVSSRNMLVRNNGKHLFHIRLSFRTKQGQQFGSITFYF